MTEAVIARVHVQTTRARTSCTGGDVPYAIGFPLGPTARQRVAGLHGQEPMCLIPFRSSIGPMTVAVIARVHVRFLLGPTAKF